MYVRAGEVGRFTGVREGTYTVQTAYGDGFRRDRFGFCLTHSFGQFDRVAEFYRSYADGMTYTSAHTLTLHKVADGNVRQQALDSASFAASLAAGGM